MSEIQAQVDELIKELRIQFASINQRIRLNELAMQTFTESEFNSINVIQPAFPDIKKPWIVNLFKSLAVGMIMLLFLPVIFFAVRLIFSFQP